jgi:predicted N-acetyltransferase YhbS
MEGKASPGWLTGGVTVIRPMLADDAEAVDDLCLDVLYEVHRAESATARRARALARIRHTRETDPGGAWVAEDDGRVAGVAMSLVRF